MCLQCGPRILDLSVAKLAGFFSTYLVQIQAAVANCFETGGASTNVVLLRMVIF